ncbi:MAG: ATP-binding protein [Deferribacterales bacterium]
MKSSLKLELTLPSNIKLIPLIGNLVETFVNSIKEEIGSIDFDDLAFKLDLALTEATANAIKHGNKEKEELPVKIKIEYFNNELTIDVIDYGKGLNTENLDINMKNIFDSKDSGRGIFIIKQIMDEVSHSYENGEFKFKMTKKIYKD